ncbi:tyrosine-type recombinase/integrase [Roseburia faecis]|uniref:tyrosine-type recombinase/integrase n=1 Tax=Roseburia faecis TaxID=301302 RepID=UPI003F964598
MKRKSSNGITLKNGEYEKKTGGYIYRWTDNWGNRHSVGAKTLNDLRKKELVVQEEKARGISRARNTLYEQARMYLSTKVTLAQSTRSNYEYYLEHSIKNAPIGKIRISDLKSSDILRFYADLISEKGYSMGTVKILHKIIHPALEMAVRDRLIYSNVSEGCVRDYTEEQEKKYALTKEEKEEFLARIKDQSPQYLPFVKFLFASGVRLSEAIGLTWNDVVRQKETGFINIDHQIQYRKINGKPMQYASDTKTAAGKRKIPITPELEKILEEQSVLNASVKVPDNYSVGGYSDFVFLSPKGTCLSHNTIRCMMTRLSRDSKKRSVSIRHVSPHICRHTYITEMAAKGCDLKVLQALVGQKDLRVTYNVYNHLDDKRVRMEMQRLGMIDAEKKVDPVTFGDNLVTN